MNQASLIVATALLATLGSAQYQNIRRQKVPAATEECALFKSNDTIAVNHAGSSFIEIGDVYVDDGFSISMDVIPSPLNHNGILFAVGSKRQFDYYEWKSAAVHTQFIVVEFIFSALALTVKSLGTEHLQQIEVFKTFPVPYRINTGQMHHIKAFRDKDVWKLMLDDKNITSPVTNQTNVQIIGKPGFIGGRPGYTNHQFQGIIRNVKINGRSVTLSGKKMGNEERGTHRFVEVWHCNSDPVHTFMAWIRQSRFHVRD